MRIAVVRFPGSNCDFDTLRAASHVGADAYFVWHREDDLRGADAVVLPGGFAYGDYLRAGAIARFSPVMKAVGELARGGGPVLGICNGFQVLCEAGLLPGGLMRNAGSRFVSQPVEVRVESVDTPCTSAYPKGAIITLPVAHGEGRYVADDVTLRHLEDDELVVLRYTGENPNGSAHEIAGVTSAERNVVGMMPHPERAADDVLRQTSGAGVFTSMVTCLERMGGGAA